MNTRLAVPDNVLRRVKELFDLVRPEMKLRDVILMLRHNRAVIRILAVELLDDVDHYVRQVEELGRLLLTASLHGLAELRTSPASVAPDRARPRARQCRRSALSGRR